MQRYGVGQHKYWDFIEDGYFDWKGATPKENVYFREVAAGFLRATFEPPAGYVVDVLEAKYVSLFPVIALGWNYEHEPLSLSERQAFIRTMVEPLHRFVSAVDWAIVSQIKFGPDAGGATTQTSRRLAVTWIHIRKPGEIS